MDGDRRLDRGLLAVLGQDGRAGGEVRRRRGTARARRCRRRARRAAARPIAAPRSSTRSQRRSSARRDEAARDHLRRGRQAAEDGARRGRAGGVDLPLRRGRGAARSPARWCRWTRRAAGAGSSGFTIRVPVGVVAAISPFNFPLNLVAHKIAPALAAGCPVVLKPASATPLSALFLAELEQDAGLPPGWLNVVAGPSAEIGDVLVEDERVKLITFTGSAEVGWGIAARAARKRVKLELGNSTPLIVDEGADLDAAAAAIAANAFSFAGQSCISIQRVYALAGVYDELARRVVERVEALTVGDPADRRHRRRAADQRAGRPRPRARVDRRVGRRGAHRRRAHRRRPAAADGDREPAADAKVECDEAFGPVCTISPVASLDEAIARANGTRYGLQAGIFTPSLEQRSARRARARVRRRRRQRGADVPRRPDALRRDQGVGQHEGRPGLGGARDDRGAPGRHRALTPAALRASGGADVRSGVGDSRCGSGAGYGSPGSGAGCGSPDQDHRCVRRLGRLGLGNRRRAVRRPHDYDAFLAGALRRGLRRGAAPRASATTGLRLRLVEPTAAGRPGGRRPPPPALRPAPVGASLPTSSSAGRGARCGSGRGTCPDPTSAVRLSISDLAIFSSESRSFGFGTSPGALSRRGSTSSRRGARRARTQAGEVLLVADHELRDRDAARLLERLQQQAVGLLGAVLREQVVALTERERVDLVDRDELANVDRVGQLDVEPVDVVFVSSTKRAFSNSKPRTTCSGSTCLPVFLLTLS